MKTVKIDNGVVAEIIPTYALPPEKWYGKEFASHCIEAPDEVEQHWTYKDGVFAKLSNEPQPAPPDPDTDRDTMLVDLDYRLTLLELGVN